MFNYMIFSDKQYSWLFGAVCLEAMAIIGSIPSRRNIEIMSETGVFYIATGVQFVDEAELSAQSVRDTMPEAPIAIATDVEPEFEFDHVIKIDDPDYSFTDQISNLHRSPFDRTLHLDTDIYVDANAEELFDVLDQFDIAVAHNHNRSAFDPPGVPDSFPEYNTGVVAYTNDNKLRGFTKSWESIYNDLFDGGNPQNQPSFRKALYESDLRIATLPPEYNLMLRYPGHAIGEVKLFHGRLLDIDTPGSGKFTDVEKAAEKINATTDHRVFTQLGGISVHSNKESNPIHWVRMGIWRHGFVGACKRGVSKIRQRFR